MTTMIDLAANAHLAAATVSADTSYSGIPVPPHLLGSPGCGWIVSVQSHTGAGPLTFTLEESVLQAGPYTTLAGPFTWPAAMPSGQIPMGISASASLARHPNARAQYVRLSVSPGAGGSVTFTSWLGKMTDGGPGLGSKPNSILTGI
jgi:hypothetical protein